MFAFYKRGNPLGYLGAAAWVVRVLLFFLFFAIVGVQAAPHYWDSYIERVELAKSRNAIPQKGADREDAIHISVVRDGKVFFSAQLFTHEQVTPASLPQKIDAAIENGRKTG
jgi:hypothetical protein